MKALYIITGTDPYLFNEAVKTLKAAWCQNDEVDEIRLLIHDDWSQVATEANSYALFCERTLLDVRFDKKTIDSSGKKVIETYLEHINPNCLIIIQAPSTLSKSWKALAAHEQIVLVQVAPLTNAALLNWIRTEMNNKGICFEPEVPALIQRYTEGHHFAAAQVIEKLCLMNDETTIFSVKELNEMLTDQCSLPLYELADACLHAKATKAIHLIRLAAHQRTEPTLMLWLLSQEIRQLIQLSFLLKQSMPIAQACANLKIWPKRVKSYDMALKRLQKTHLCRLLHDCVHLDERIKSSQDQQIWQSIETLALELCLGEPIV